MPASTKGEVVVEEKSSVGHIEEDPNAEFGGTEARKALERKLLLKLDLRMSIMVIIYILNYVRSPVLPGCSVLISLRLTETMPGMSYDVESDKVWRAS